MSIRKGNDIIASTPAVDTVPQQGSANVITSGGVYTAFQDYVTLSTSQTITGNKAFNGATISTNSDIEFTSVVAGLISNRNGTKRNLITRTNFNEVNVGNPYDPTIILGSGVRPHYNTIEYLALYSDIPGNFTGATAGAPGTNGLVPAPAAGDEGKFLQGDGTWTTVDALPVQTGHSGEYLTTDGSTASWAPASGEPDNTTITKNASDKLQAVAVIDQNAGGIVKTWKGTLAEYNLLGTYSNDTEYIVTDDETGGASVYTKAEVDNGFVALTGAQTVAGSKTFVDSIHYKETSITRGTAPNANKYSDINFIDTNGKWLAGFEHMVLTDKTSSFAMIVSDMVNDTGNVAGSIVLEQKSNGTVITGCPASGATANSILTNVACSIGGSGYVKFGNGLIIQWGGVQAEGWPNTKWVGLPTAFSTNDYSVVVTPVANGSNYTQTAYLPDLLYTTGFSVTSGINGTTPQSLWCRWIAIGY